MAMNYEVKPMMELTSIEIMQDLEELKKLDEEKETFRERAEAIINDSIKGTVEDAEKAAKMADLVLVESILKKLLFRQVVRTLTP